jgi:hypothetical protein
MSQYFVCIHISQAEEGTLGTLRYGASRTTLRIDDRVLAHLQTVITTKLRRNEGLLLQWERDSDAGSGRGALWVHPSTELIYEYEGGREPALDGAELDRMMADAAGTRGLKVAASEAAPA